MMSRRFQNIGFVSFLCGGAMLVHHGVQAQVVDGIFVPSTPANATAPAHQAPAYDSEYAAEERLSGAAGNTPEADARPGEYFFVMATDAVRKKNYQFAIQMYQAAASWAYKPAEFNLAVMYARGQGVPTDLPRGMAWMALAAERNEKHYVDAREAVYAEMTKEQFDQANVIWRELKKTYGDEVALRRAKARWAEVRANMTGSRVGSAAVALEVGMPGPGLAPRSSVPYPNQKKGSSGERKRGSGIIGTTSAEVLSGQGVDGSTAYGQLQQSDNPYDPKFELSAFGTATVGSPTPAAAGSNEATPDKPDPAKHNQ